MLQTLILIVALAIVGWRLGVLALLCIVAALWLGGLVVLFWNDPFALHESMPATARLWALSGGLALIVLAYAAGLGALRRKAGLRVPAGTGETGARPSSAAVPLALHSPIGVSAPPAADPVAADPVPTVPADPSQPLSDAELDRYARHIVLRELGGAGQRRLRAARVLVVGAGGLGAPVLMYLAAAGVGRITVADDDTVGLSNLQRQVIFATDDVGRPKAEAAAEALGRLNPHVAVTPLTRRIGAKDAELVAAHDLVLDGTDSFASRQAINAACVAAGVPLIAGSIAQWEGQLALYDPAHGGPCLACLFPQPPAAGLALPCAEAGVVGALPGVIGSLMALEAIKHLAGVSDGHAGGMLLGRMLIFDGLWGDTRSVTIPRRPDCAICGGVTAA